jgi:hypothetical protein
VMEEKRAVVVDWRICGFAILPRLPRHKNTVQREPASLAEMRPACRSVWGGRGREP